MKFLPLIILSLCFSCFAFADAVIFSAQVANKIVNIQGNVELVYTIENANNPKAFNLPTFPQFNIISGPNQSSSFTSFNGKVSSTVSISLALQPKQIGKFILPPAEAVIDGKTIRSNSVQIEVVKNGAIQTPSPKAGNPLEDFFEEDPTNPFFSNPSKKDNSSAPPNLSNLKEKVFAQLELSKNKVYQGEQLLASYCIYSQMPLQITNTKIPTPEGFWSENITDPNNAEAGELVTINGKSYKKYIIHKLALFPTSAGKLQVPAINLDAAIPYEKEIGNEDNSIGGLFNSLLRSVIVEQIPITLNTNAADVEVIPLPTAPPNFSGAVGDFELENNISSVEISTDDPITITYILRGKGNLKQVPLPNTFFSGDWDVAEPKIHDSITSYFTELAGYKIFTYTLLPRNTGEFFIPPATFTYFNTNTQNYETLKSNQYTVKVNPGKNIDALSKSNKLPKDIHDIIVDENIKKQERNYWIEKPWFWSLWLLPLILFGISYWYNIKKQARALHFKEDIKLGYAENRMSMAKEHLEANNLDLFYKECQKAIWLYLSDVLEIPTSKLQKEEAYTLLQNKGITMQTIATLKEVQTNCDQALYGVGNTANANNTLQQSIAVMQTINKILV